MAPQPPGEQLPHDDQSDQDSATDVRPLHDSTAGVFGGMFMRLSPTRRLLFVTHVLLQVQELAILYNKKASFAIAHQLRCVIVSCSTVANETQTA